MPAGSIHHDRPASSYNGESTEQNHPKKELSSNNYDTKMHKRQRPRDFSKKSVSSKGSDIPDNEEKQFFKELLDTLLDGTSPPKSPTAIEDTRTTSGTKEFSKIEQQLRNMALNAPPRRSPARLSSVKDTPKAPRLFDEIAGSITSSLWEDSSPTIDLVAKDKELKQMSAITELRSSVDLTKYVLDELLNPDKEIDENYPSLLAASIKHASFKLNDPYLALSIFQQVKSRGIESYIAGCTTGVYNTVLNLRWETWKDIEGMDALIQEMVANGVSFNDGTRRSVRDAIEEIERDYSGHGISGDGIRWSSEQHQAAARMRAIVSKWLVK
ncbi:hypothetical protein INT43_000716 [Umbelopsis isabellina]|uniref:Mtf2-like C-terminal domain-containing protein n=1 Tax=Mortierella isabellina TaxID=91625 RepID=A0A8H7Q2N6_MORIS|nr:hypothetical protein INT43_000716 [Umbelopsis isabellina]